MPVKTRVPQGSVLGPLLDSPKFASQSDQSVYPYLNEFYEWTTAFCENQLTLKDTLSETGFYKVGNLHGWMKKLPHNTD